MNDCLVDVHEPEQALPLLNQSVEAAKEAINSQGYADYLWSGTEGREQLERKTWDEVLSNMDSVEDQLRREAQAHPDVHTNLVIEGVATQATMGGSRTWAMAKGKQKVMYAKNNHRDSMGKAYAWEAQVKRYMPVYHTATFQETMILVAALVKAAQKEDHTTFQRHFREMDWHPNEQVMCLINMFKRSGIGPGRAEALIKRFGTVWNVIHQMPQTLSTVDNMGVGVAKRLLRKLGKPNV
jgi:hypothetical protein